MNKPWIFYIIIGVTVIQWVFGKLQEQAAQKRAQQRLGQPPKAPNAPITSSRRPLPTRPVNPSPTITQTELQARRQAQLRALRERQAKLVQRQSTARPQPPRPAARPAMRSPQPVVRRTPPTSHPTPASAPTRSPQPSRVHRALLPTAAKRQAAIQNKRQSASLHVMQHERQLEQQARQKSLSTEQDKRSKRRIAKPVAAPAPASAVSPSSSIAPRTRADWRRAIIASEILAQPLALRSIES